MRRHPVRTPAAVLALVALALLTAQGVDAAGARLYKSGPIQVSGDGRWVWAVNPDSDSVARIDTGDDSVVEFPLDPDCSPRGLSLREDGSEVWIACHDLDRVEVLSGADGTRLGAIDLPWGSGPYSVALSRDQRQALVTLHRSESLAVLDVGARAVSHLLQPVYRSPIGIAWTEDGLSAWVTHLFADGEHPQLTRVDFSAPVPKVTTSIRVLATQPQNSLGLASPPAEGGYLTHRGHLAQIPSASGRQEVWLPTQYNNIHDNSWSPESVVQTTMRHVRLAGRTVPNTNNDKVVFTAVEVHDPGNSSYAGPGWNARISGPIDLGFASDGQTGLLLNELSNDLLVFPTATPAVKPVGASPLVEIAVGDRPIGIALSPTSSLAYVANYLSRDVSVIDLAALVELRRIGTTPSSGEPLPAPVLQGARLFHTSADRRISPSDKVACASCHINAEHDGRLWSLNLLPTNHGNRSVQTLLGLSLTFAPADPVSGYGQLHLSGDRDEVQDFEHTFRGPMMGGTGFLGSAVCPDVAPPSPACRNAGKDPDLDAIASYLLALEPLARSPHRAEGGALSEAAVRGATFFLGGNRAGKPADSACAGCHVPRLPTTPAGRTVFADLRFHDIGARPAAEEELNARAMPWTWAMNTQSLVGVWATPPWEGRATYPAGSMIELLQDMAGRARSTTPHGTPDGLTGRQLEDLAEFVLSIDGDMTEAEVLAARDTTPPRIVRVSPTSLTRVEVWFSESVDPLSAEDPASYRIVHQGGADMPVLAATWDARRGDRVTLAAQLDAGCSDVTYTLTPERAILDVADTASGGAANAMDPADPRNRHTFTIGATIAVTLGASGGENLDVAVHDVAMIAGLTDYGHDSVFLAGAGNGGNKGLVRFDWSAALGQASGIASSADIVAASFSLQGEVGDSQTLELRRVLQPWSDNNPNDFSRQPPGGVTWIFYRYNSGAWNTPGALAFGGTGNQLNDYGGGFDLAQSIDLTLTPQAINQRTVFSGPKLLEAFRFWYDNPQVDYGYALLLAPGATNELRFERTEHELGAKGPVLTITYALPPAPQAPGEVSGRGALTPLYLVKQPAGAVGLRFEDLAPVATAYNLYEGAIGGWYSHAGASCGFDPPLLAGARSWSHAPAAGSRYFQVTAANACAEGAAAASYPPQLSDCPP